MLNRCEFIGRLGADPEIRSLNSGGKVANMRLAVSETWRDKQTGEKKEKTEWVSVVIFSEVLAKVAEQYLKKCSQVYISGKWQTREWEKDGVKRYSTECILQGFDSKLVMLGGRQDGGGEVRTEPARQAAASGGYGDIDEIPF